MKTLISFIFILSCVSAYTQNIREDMIKLNEQYGCSQNINIISKYKYYNNIKKSAVPDKIITGKMIKDGDNFLLQADNNFQVKIEGLVVAVNNDDKTISFSQAKNYNHNYLIDDIEKSLDYISNYSFSDSVKGIKHYKLYYDESMPYYQVDIVINTTTGFLSKYICYAKEYPYMHSVENYSEKDIKHVKLEIEYTINHNQVAEKNKLFNINSYLIINGNEVTPAPKYAGYEIINLKI